MDVRMGSEDGLVVGSPEQMCGQFHSELMMQLPVWRERLSQQLGSLNDAGFTLGHEFPPSLLSALLLPKSYNGMLPCFFGGFVSRLFRSISNASMSRGRVSWGSITSSM